MTIDIAIANYLVGVCLCGKSAHLIVWVLNYCSIL